jgi:predicted transcriptional regulator
MQRTTLSLPDDLAAALKREAARRRKPVSEVAREAIAEYIQPRHRVPFVALGRSDGTENISENVEEILAREWVDPLNM